MKELNLALLLLAILLFGCKKNLDGHDVRGTVIQKGGCFTNSWLVKINNTAAANDYLCEATLSSPGGYDCTNAVFVELPASLAEAGKDIRFDITGTQLTCLSSSFAPMHATVKNLRAD